MAIISVLSDEISGRKNEKGAVLFILAAGLVTFLLFAGLAIDLSMLYNVKTDLQNAMDASALAGAAQLDGTTNGVDQAVTKALSMTNKYHFNNTPVGLTASDVTFSATRDSGYVSQATAAASPASIRFVRVETRKTMDLAFMKISGVSTHDVSAFAVAGKSPPINTVCDGLLPLAPPGGPGAYVVGLSYPLQFVGPAQPVGSNNTYLLLNFTPLKSSGDDPVRDLLEGGSAGCIGIGDSYVWMQGVTPEVAQQAVQLGLNNRFNSDTDLREGISHINYTGNGRRVLPIPLVSKTPPPIFTPIANSSDPLYIYDIVCFFMQYRVPSLPTADVAGEFIGKCSVGEGKSDPARPAPGGSGLPSEAKLVLYR
jgi:Flp pilus assembly protein TadG